MMLNGHVNGNGCGTRQPRYALISPVRDEEEFIEATIRSVIAQTLRPVVWLVISNNSRDRTDEIVESYARRHSFIQLVRVSNQGARDFAAKVNAFNQAYGIIWPLEFEFIGNLDADVTLPADYYAAVLKEFRLNPRLGIAGGIIFENIGGEYRRQDSSPLHTPGATQMFRRGCLEAIGGYLPLRGGGEDSAADIMARMGGWQTRSFEHLHVQHHRRVGSGLGGMLRTRFQAGVTDYALGKHPLFVLLKSLRRVGERPVILSSLYRLLGFCCACVRREKRLVPRDFVRYVRREQFQRMLTPKLDFAKAGIEVRSAERGVRNAE